MNPSTPIHDFFKRKDVAYDVRLLAAQGALASDALDQLSLLILLLDDPDPTISRTAGDTLASLPTASVEAFLARPDVPIAMREFFAGRGIAPGGVEARAEGAANASGLAAPDAGEVDTTAVDLADGSALGDDTAADAGATADAVPDDDADEDKGSLLQRLAAMSFTERLKAASKGSREMRAVLIRDPNKLIASTVLSSPKLTEQEVESFARMANVTEDVLRTISTNRAWMKNYGIVSGLVRNPKAPLAVSLRLLMRLNDRDAQMLSMDRNVPGPLRIAARKRVVDGTKA